MHGLTREDTEDAPVFPAVWAQIKPLIEGLPLVAHNRPFDESCLKAVFRVYQMDYPDYESTIPYAWRGEYFRNSLTISCTPWPLPADTVWKPSPRTGRCRSLRVDSQRNIMTPMKKILLAIDSFKGCLSSEEVEATFSQALTAHGAEVRSLPMSDGGEGMLPAFITALHGELLKVEVHDR